MAEQRTIPPRDVHVLAAYKSFTPPPGNAHDVIFAAIRHGYDVGVGEADAENARLRQDVANRDSRLRADDELMRIAGIDGPGAEKALAAHDAAILAPLQAKLDAVKALIAPMWRPLDYDRNALIDDLRAILNGEEPNNE